MPTEKEDITQMITIILSISQNNENFENNEQFWAASNQHAGGRPETGMKFSMV